MAELRILVTGGRDYRDAKAVRFWLSRAFQAYATADAQVTLVHGGAPGADRLAAHIASDLGWSIEPHYADWQTHGSAAGPIRNREMVDAGADVCVAFPGGRGTAHCRTTAETAGIPIIDVTEEAGQ